MKPIKLDTDIAQPFTKELDDLREKGEHSEAFEMLDNLSEQAAHADKPIETDDDTHSDTED